MADRDQDLGRLEVLRARLRHSLPARFLLRYHLALIVVASVTCGWIADVVLLRAGLRSMIARYPLAVGVSYSVFVLGIGAWLRYSGIAEFMNQRRAEELMGDKVPHAPRPLSGISPRDVAEAGVNAIPVDEGCLWFLILGVVFLAVGGYTVMTAPTFFADVVLEVLLAAGLVRGVRRASASGWMTSVFANTWGSLGVALLLALFAGLFALGLEPHPSTFGELWYRLHKH